MTRTLLMAAVLPALTAACAPAPLEPAAMNNRPLDAAAPPSATVPPGVDASRTPDSPDAARGRRTLSTAFVMVGPDGRLTVELRDGRVLVLEKVRMNARDYCGVLVAEAAAGAGPPGPRGSKFCGGYAEVAAARPGGGPNTPPAIGADGRANPLETR